jgi:hypothetical protein
MVSVLTGSVLAGAAPFLAAAGLAGASSTSEITVSFIRTVLSGDLYLYEVSGVVGAVLVSLEITECGCVLPVVSAAARLPGAG